MTENIFNNFLDTVSEFGPSTGPSRNWIFEISCLDNSDSLLRLKEIITKCFKLNKMDFVFFFKFNDRYFIYTELNFCCRRDAFMRFFFQMGLDPCDMQKEKVFARPKSMSSTIAISSLASFFSKIRGTGDQLFFYGGFPRNYFRGNLDSKVFTNAIFPFGNWINILDELDENALREKLNKSFVIPLNPLTLKDPQPVDIESIKTVNELVAEDLEEGSEFMTYSLALGLPRGIYIPFSSLENLKIFVHQKEQVDGLIRKSTCTLTEIQKAETDVQAFENQFLFPSLNYNHPKHDLYKKLGIVVGFYFIIYKHLMENRQEHAVTWKLYIKILTEACPSCYKDFQTPKAIEAAIRKLVEAFESLTGIPVVKNR